MSRMTRNTSADIDWQAEQCGWPATPRAAPGTRYLNALLVASAAVTLIAVYWLIGAESAKASAGRTETHPECARLARVVAGRTHSILEGDRFRATERQAYAVCISDPAAFRRIVRSY